MGSLFKGVRLETAYTVFFAYHEFWDEFFPNLTGWFGTRGKGSSAVGLLRALQAHFFYPGEQGGWFYAQEFCRAVDTFDFPAGFFQDGQEIFAFALLHFGFGEKIKGGGGGGIRR